MNEGIDKWKDTQFVESDPYMNNEIVCDIVLCVDWEKQSCTVETRQKTNSTPAREYYKIDEVFRLPDTLDTTQFLEYYNEKIKPALQERGEFFEIVWNGHNNIGVFTNFDDEDIANDYGIVIQDICDCAHSHDKFICFNLASSFDDYKDIIICAEQVSIDFMTCDLDDATVVQKIMDYLEDDYVYIGTNDRGEEMKRMKESIVENEEG